MRDAIVGRAGEAIEEVPRRRAKIQPKQRPAAHANAHPRRQVKPPRFDPPIEPLGGREVRLRRSGANGRNPAIRKRGPRRKERSYERDEPCAIHRNRRLGNPVIGRVQPLEFEIRRDFEFPPFFASHGIPRPDFRQGNQQPARRQRYAAADRELGTGRGLAQRHVKLPRRGIDAPGSAVVHDHGLDVQTRREIEHPLRERTVRRAEVVLEGTRDLSACQFALGGERGDNRGGTGLRGAADSELHFRSVSKSKPPDAQARILRTRERAREEYVRGVEGRAIRGQFQIENGGGTGREVEFELAFGGKSSTGRRPLHLQSLTACGNPNFGKPLARHSQYGLAAIGPDRSTQGELDGTERERRQLRVRIDERPLRLAGEIVAGER